MNIKKKKSGGPIATALLEAAKNLHRHGFLDKGKMREIETLLNRAPRQTKIMKHLPEKHKDIARIDQPSKKTHGWYVRIRFLGTTHSKFFSDGKYGGRHSSLLSAIAWRDNTEKRIGKPRTNKHIVTVSNTQTGVVGVRLNEKLNRYEVSWVNVAGKQGKTSVSIRKHGKGNAFEMACQIRQQKEAERLSTNVI